MPSIPNSVLLKIHRAQVHADDLKSEIRAYYALQPARIVRHPQSTSENPSVKLETVIPIPHRIALIAGDCVQNLRSALDYLVWELVLREGNTPKKQALPVCTTPDGWRAVFKSGRLDGVGLAAIEEIHSMQPYRVADFRASSLYVLDELANMNKHRHLFVTMLAGTSMSGFTAVVLPDGDSGYLGSAFADKDAPIPALQAPGQSEPYADVASFIAFDEGVGQGADIGSVIGKLMLWTRTRIPIGFDKFFD